MADGFNIQFQGWDEFLSRLKKAPSAIQEEVKAELADQAELIAENMKVLAPARVGIPGVGAFGGTLRDLIGVDPPTNNGLSINIYSKANYSAYVEWGTGTKVDVPDKPEGLPEYAITFKGTHEVPGMYPRPYFFVSVNYQIPYILAAMKKVIDNI